MRKAEIIKSIYSYNRVRARSSEFDIVNHRIILQLTDIILIHCFRRNNQNLLVVALKTSTKLDDWFWIIPTEQQIKVMRDHSAYMLSLFDELNFPQYTEKGLKRFVTDLGEEHT